MRPRLLGLPSSLCLRIPQRYRSTRAYNYSLDHLGQLFLEDTKIRNFTSCYKDPAFLDFLYTRTRLNDSVEDEEARLKREEGYEFVSPCGREVNYLAPDDSVLVFQKLIPEGLTFAGSFVHPFDPSSLRVDPTSGYLYHPSPPKPSKRRLPDPASASPYGPYSLLRSSLVLDTFASSLELDDEGGGSYEWGGKRWEIGVLEEGQVWRSRKGG